VTLPDRPACTCYECGRRRDAGLSRATANARAAMCAADVLAVAVARLLGDYNASTEHDSQARVVDALAAYNTARDKVAT